MTDLEEYIKMCSKNRGRRIEINQRRRQGYKGRRSPHRVGFVPYPIPKSVVNMIVEERREEAEKKANQIYNS